MEQDAGTTLYEDEIDLREYLDVLWKGKWLIAAIVATAVAIAGVLSFVVILPTYEATQVVGLSSSEEAGGLELQVYAELATSLPVMEQVLRAVEPLEEGLHAGSLANRFDTRVDASSRLLTVTASAHDPREAYRLSTAWLEGFTSEVHAFWQGQLTDRLALAEEQLRERRANYERARAALDAFDRENQLDVLDARLSRLGGELAAAESKLRDLRLDAIPTDRARLAYLEEALAQETRTLAEPGKQAAVLSVDAGAGVISSDVTVLNPVYLQLSQDLAATRTRLTVNESQASSLEDRLSALAAEIQDLRNRVITLRTERENLAREASLAEELYTEARARQEDIRGLLGRSAEFAGVSVVSPASTPTAPVAPRKALNMAVAFVVGGFGGVFAVLLRHWWASGKQAEDRETEQSSARAPTATSWGPER